MKRLILFVFLLSFVFFSSFSLAKRYPFLLRARIGQAHEERFKPASFPLKNHPFAILIVGANNGAFVAKTLSSVLSQNYDAYKVIYIDDASDDGSFEVAKDYIYESDQFSKVTLVRNEEKLGVLANLYRAVQTLSDEEIVVVLQGEDWLAHEWVLQRLNAYYADPDLWIAFAKYKNFPSYETVEGMELNESFLRSLPFARLQCNTFYAALFKQIKESDLVCGGDFLRAHAEMAYMMPMLEMAKNHACCIPEILYIRNLQSCYKESKESQIRAEKFIRGLDRYQPLAMLKVNPCGE